MLHAKATLAWGGGVDADGANVTAAFEDVAAFVGSANLVRGSMNLPVHTGLLPYDELNVLVSERRFCVSLNESMATLFERAVPIAPGTDLLGESEWYSEATAQWEELWQ